MVRKTRLSLVVLVIAFAVMTLGTLGLGGCRREPQTVKLVMGYIPNVQFAPWYVAQEKGYFEEAGLEITMDYAKINDVMRLLATGEIDFLIAGGDEVVVARSQDLPVTYVMALYARFPAAVVSFKEEAITEPADLRGRTIGFPGFYGTNYIAIKAILARAGMTESDVTLLPVGYNQVAMLSEGKVDAIVGFDNNEPIQLHNLGFETNVIHSYDYFDLVGHGVVVGEIQLSENPERVQAFVKATLKGMDYALKNPDEAFEICLKYAPESGGSNAEVQKQVLLESMKLWQSAYTGVHGLGSSDPEAWSASQQSMLEWGLIQKETPAELLVNNDYIDY